MSVRTGGNHCSISAECLYDYVQKSRVSTNVRSVLISVISASVSSVFPCLPVVGALVQRVQTQERKYTRLCMFCREDLFTNNISSYFHYPLPFIIITRYPLLSLPLTLSVNDNTCRNALILSVTRNPQLLRLLDNRRRFSGILTTFCLNSASVLHRVLSLHVHVRLYLHVLSLSSRGLSAPRSSPTQIPDFTMQPAPERTSKTCLEVFEGF